ncbi:hypothetical protein [Demequina soli]|uniref:hypothetical protein n=1 Tax=Demequina soli TaxID=1638987 RepID=UPI000783582B|nr:hypothetical protein [Demequina soli]
MWTLARTPDGPRLMWTHVRWARIVALLLIAWWALMVIANMLLDGGSAGSIAVWTLVIGAPGVTLLYRLGVDRTCAVREVVATREVEDGLLVTVMDDRARRHEVLTDPSTAAAVARAVAGAE